MTNQEVMDFPSSIYEFLIDYSFKDSDEVYTNGILLIPTFRVKQAIEHYFEQTRWIPCVERLPEDYIHVLCQFTLGGMGECYLAHGAFHVVGGLVMTCNEVIAWMPLPERYEIPEQLFGCAED